MKTKSVLLLLPLSFISLRGRAHEKKSHEISNVYPAQTLLLCKKYSSQILSIASNPIVGRRSSLASAQQLLNSHQQTQSAEAEGSKVKVWQTENITEDLRLRDVFFSNHYYCYEKNNINIYASDSIWWLMKTNLSVLLLLFFTRQQERDLICS